MGSHGYFAVALPPPTFILTNGQRGTTRALQVLEDHVRFVLDWAARYILSWFTIHNGLVLQTAHRVSSSASPTPLLPFNHTLATSYVPRYSPLPNAVHAARSSPPLNNPCTPFSW